MRRIVSLLKEYRIARHQAAGATPEKLAEVGQKFEYLDSALSQVRLNEQGGFDEPESKLAEVMTSADFTYAIQEFVQRQMLPGYQEMNFAFEPLVKLDVVPNFLNVSRYQRRSGLDDLEYVGEKGEARPGSIPDATKRQYRVYKWEKQFDFSMEALVNDDLGYLTDSAADMGRSARRTLEKFVSRMYTNAVSIARLVGLGALYSTTGRLTTARISTARMGFAQRTDGAGNMINAPLKYLVYHVGLQDTVDQIRQSTLVPELATNGANTIRNSFEPIADPYITGTAPNLPWYAFSDWKQGVVPLVLARRQGVPGPMILRKRSDIESVTSLLGAGSAVPPVWGDFATGNVVIKVHDEWGTYIDTTTEGNLFDYRGAYYSSGTAA